MSRFDTWPARSGRAAAAPNPMRRLGEEAPCGLGSKAQAACRPAANPETVTEVARQAWRAIVDRRCVTGTRLGEWPSTVDL